MTRSPPSVLQPLLTNTFRLLRAGLLDTPYSLTEARVIFELAQQDVMPLARLREIVADYIEERQPGRDNAWIAEFDGQRAGCVFLDQRRAGLRATDLRAAGFQLTDENRHHSFGHGLTGQTWDLDLTGH